MPLLWFILVGLVAGWLAGVLVQGRGYGAVADILLGIVGAIVGGFAFRLIGIAPGSLLGEIVMATIGAVIFIAIVKAVHKAV